MKKYLLLFVFLATALFISGQERKVLFLSSYNPSFPSYYKQLEGLRTYLPNGSVTIDEEFMDTKRLGGGEENILNFYTRLKYKTERLNPYDLVILGDDHALLFMQRYGKELFPGIPYVFLGINDIDNGLSEKENPLSTGVLEKKSYADTLRLITNQNSHGTAIYIICDGTVSGQADLNNLLQEESRTHTLPLVLFSLEDHSFEELYQSLSSLDPKEPILLLSLYEDKNGTRLEFSESFDLIYEQANGPIYHLWEHGFGRGILGGCVVNHVRQGEEAGKLALRILEGESPSQIPILEESPNIYLFDYKELQKNRSFKRNLPEEYELINSPFISRQRLNTIIVILALSLLAFLLVIMAFVHLNGKVKESRDRFAMFFDDNPVNLILVDPDNGQIKDANKAAVDFYGYSYEELTNLKIYEINQFSTPEINRGMEKASADRQNYFIFRHKLKNGEIKDVEIFSGPLKSEGKTYLLSAVHDISEKSRLQKELLQEQKINSLGYLAGGIAHDFNNLLTGILGYTDLLKAEKAYNEVYLDNILASSLKAKNLTHRILSYARGKKKIRQDISLANIVIQALEETQGILPAGIGIITDFNGSCKVKAVHSEMVQVIQNLLSNAVQSMEKRKGQIHICINPMEVDEHNSANYKGLSYGYYEVLEVEDQGKGMSEEAQSQLFDPYFTTKQKVRGTGLGLALVRSIVDEMDGLIKVESALNKGTLFKVYLPSARTPNI
ncbi:MAG: ATP-binding protein [Spirochaetales bacterium]|nr:ATP-binding protein [Spirochaetales bacterium]